MKKVLLLSVLFSLSVFSQERISKKLGNFNQVKVFSGLNVKLIKIEDSNTQNYVEIKGGNNEDVVVKNINGLLKLSVIFPKAFDEDSTLITLYYNNDLDLIDVNEGAFVSSDKLIKQEFIEIKGQEGAQLELRLQVNTLKVKSISGAEINLSGKVEKQTVLLNTGGVYDGFDLQSKQAEVSSSTGAEALINVSDLLDAKAKLKGFIFYLKEPKKLIKKEIIGGEVLLKNNF